MRDYIASITGTGRLLKSEKAIAAAFKGYDSCSMPLLELVGVLTRETGPTVFTKAVYEELETCGVSKVCDGAMCPNGTSIMVTADLIPCISLLCTFLQLQGMIPAHD